MFLEKYGSNTDCGGVFLENMAVILIRGVGVSGKYGSNTDLWMGCSWKIWQLY